MPEVSKESAQAIFVEMMFNDQQLGTGTAFLVAPGEQVILVTNRHNVTGRRQDNNQPLHRHGGIPNKMRVWHHREVLGEFESVIYDILDNEESQLWFEHPFLGPVADMAALKIAVPDHLVVHPVDVNEPQADLIQLRPSDIVSVIGFPFGLMGGRSFATWATGFIATEPQLDHGELPVFLIDCRSRQGQSGSPVLAVRHGSYQAKNGSLTAGDISVFLGIYSGRINSESDLGKVWKRSAVRQLIDSVVNPLRPHMGIGIDASWSPDSTFKWNAEIWVAPTS